MGAAAKQLCTGGPLQERPPRGSCGSCCNAGAAAGAAAKQEPRPGQLQRGSCYRSCNNAGAVSYTHLRAHETSAHL
eukprot:3799243-Alexandrium_andersonii.AAC.1